ncbi:extracellular solute-binding protein [Lichenihabitans sp. PAMC28606]|uniref:ABC transporter substrate-binding protein n=1 Tax=Lichenihabitans sp. PAMC28606 TaxID=2880932 RepID=UPI001D0B131C|nr:extracellular solute-binding protein [Lichenihabitans sp. PAMC28606]UDL96022.1 extracellular solute-binding protein [Lichenihabitans sp. PAMC28606]
MSRLDRRQFTLMASAGLASAATGLMSRAAQAADSVKTITVLNWQGYGTDEAFGLKAFAAATGIEVKHDYYNAEPEMLTKLRTNPGAYDVVLVNSARDAQAQADGLIDAVDLSKVPNAAGLADAFKTNPNITIDGKTYGVPWVWGMNALAVRKDKAAGIDSYKVFQDPAFAGRGALFDDAVTEIAVAALMTGQNINNPSDMKLIGETLKSFKKNIKLIWSSEDEWNKAFAGGAFDVSIFWSGAITRAVHLHNQPVEFVIPKEGAVGWLDNLCVPATSTKKEAGLAFINYMIDPKFYVQWATSGAPASANSAAMDMLPADDLNKQIHKPEYLPKLQFMGALPEDRRQAFNDLWEEVKAGYAH